MGKAIKKFIDRYILGEYHCDTCPYGWEDWYYEGDCDCGCYIFGDIRDSCRLIPPLRALIGWPRRKKSRYYASHQYDGFADFCEKDMQLQEKFDELFFDVLSGCKVMYKGYNGEEIQIQPNRFPFCQRLDHFRHDYEKFAHPFVPKSLKREWKERMIKTLNRFLNHFKPYFCK